MRLTRLRADHYRSLRQQEIDLNGFNLFIGANASGKSTILDALRFLSEGVRTRDFRESVHSRGGVLNLAWKGEVAQRIELSVVLEDGVRKFEWMLRLVRAGYEFQVEENLNETRPNLPPLQVLDATRGQGWWWSGNDSRVELKLAPTSCALSAAAADATFPAREVAEFIGRWGFFDPNPFLLRRDWTGLDSAGFDHYGRNLAGTLHALRSSAPERLDRILESTRSIVGLPSDVETRESEGHCYFVQREPGLEYWVHQMGVSSGTLRILALMTALHAEASTNLIGIEEPENYVHPTALSALLDHLRNAQNPIQIMVTTHSPLLLNLIDAPEVVRVVRRGPREGTVVEESENPEQVRQALDESGFGLGEFYETKGFGSD